MDGKVPDIVLIVMNKVQNTQTLGGFASRRFVFTCTSYPDRSRPGKYCNVTGAGTFAASTIVAVPSGDCLSWTK
jgi:hypothetical protein